MGVQTTQDVGDYIEEVWIEGGTIHRDLGPALRISLKGDGGKRTLCSESYFKSGLLHREDGPAVIRYDSSGHVLHEQWFLDGLRHRGDDLPAEIKYLNGKVISERWWRRGQPHRDLGPAEISYVYPTGTVDWERFWMNGQYIAEKVGGV